MLRKTFFKLHMANLSSQAETKYITQFNSYFTNTLNKLPDIGQEHVREHSICVLFCIKCQNLEILDFK